MPATTAQIPVDARWLEPPEPMESVRRTLAALCTGQAVRLPRHREDGVLIRQTHVAPDGLSGTSHTR